MIRPPRSDKPYASPFDEILRSVMRAEDDPSIPIDFSNRFARPYYAVEAKQFWGYPSPHRQFQNSAAQRRISTSKQTTNKSMRATNKASRASEFIISRASFSDKMLVLKSEPYNEL
jgi:hypothetical protein